LSLSTLLTVRSATLSRNGRLGTDLMLLILIPLLWLHRWHLHGNKIRIRHGDTGIAAIM
jgi:hypothetical protein